MLCREHHVDTRTQLLSNPCIIIYPNTTIINKNKTKTPYALGKQDVLGRVGLSFYNVYKG